MSLELRVRDIFRDVQGSSYLWNMMCGLDYCISDLWCVCEVKWADQWLSRLILPEIKGLYNVVLIL